MAHRHPQLSGCTATIAASFIACLPALAQEPAGESVAFFEKHVRPVLVTRCYGCHSGPKTKGGLALDSRAGWKRAEIAARRSSRANRTRAC